MTKTQTKFKQTEIGEIPEDWDVKPISEICENLDYMRKPITKSDRVSGDVPYYGATGIQDYVAGHLFDEDLVLVAEDCGGYESFGQTAYTISGKAWVNNHAHILRCKGINWVFLKAYLNFKDISSSINTGNRGKLNKSVLEKIMVPVPKNKEDERIASALSCVDTAISQTDAVIEQARQLKKGLMQQLFTHGIGHTKFKQTEIGEMPEEWNIVKLDSLGKVVTGKTPSTKDSSFWQGTIPFVTPTDIGEKKIQEKTERKVTEEGLREINEIPPGSLMVTCIASIGKNAISKERCCTNQQINTIIPKEDIDVEYLYYYIEKIKPYLEIMSGKTSVPILNKTEFERLIIAKPKKEEQTRIARVISSADNKIEDEIEKRAQLELLKKGLMQDLLTGRVRFPEFRGAMS